MCWQKKSSKLQTIADSMCVKDDGSEVTNNEVVARSRLRVDARKWYASKLYPKKDGDRLLNQHEGGDPDKPILSKIDIAFVSAKKPENA